MNTSQRESLRQIAAKSNLAPHASRFQQLGAGVIYLCFEWMPVGSNATTVVSLYWHENESSFSRQEYSHNSGCQEVVQCHPKMAKSHLDYLSNLGLFELNDFTPGIELLDGEFFILSAGDTTDPYFQRETDACLFCPSKAINPKLRKIDKHLHRLLKMSKETIEYQSRMCKYGLSWWMPRFSG